MPMHKNIENLKPEHFEIWLNLFKDTLDQIAPSKKVVDIFMQRANQIGQALKAGVFN